MTVYVAVWRAGAERWLSLRPDRLASESCVRRVFGLRSGSAMRNAGQSRLRWLASRPVNVRERDVRAGLEGGSSTPPLGGERGGELV